MSNPNETPTPEADSAASATMFSDGEPMVKLSVARKLERKLDSVRSALLDVTNTAVKLQEENTQLRAVCDELANEVDRDQCYYGHSINRASALARYSSLPHVKAKGQL